MEPLSVAADPTVTFHVKWKVRFFCTPFIGAMAVGLTWAIVASIVTGDWRWPTRGESTAVGVVAWIVIPLFWVPSVFATLALWRYRVTIAPDHVRYRAVAATKELPLDRIGSVRVIGGRPGSQVAPPRFDRVDIRGRGANGRIAGTSINSTFVSGDMGLTAMGAWFRARPELAGGDRRTLASLAALGIHLPG